VFYSQVFQGIVDFILTQLSGGVNETSQGGNKKGLPRQKRGSPLVAYGVFSGP